MRTPISATVACLAGLTVLGPLSAPSLAQTKPKPVQPGSPDTVQIPPPSNQFLRFVQPKGFFTIDYPDNWRTSPAGYAVTMAPLGGVRLAGGGKKVMVYGVVINHYASTIGARARRKLSLQHSYAPFEDKTAPRGSLEDATDDLVRQVMTSNTYLRAEDGSAKPETIDGAPGFSVQLTGPSPVTGQEERATLFTRSLPDGHVIYALSMAPARDHDALDRVFTRMMRSLVVNDDAVHRRP